jgi:hypothetical protein
MSSSLAKSVALVNDTPFKSRVQAAMTELALEVAAGDPNGPANPVLRALRQTLAMAVLADTAARLDPFLRLVANDNTISGAADAAAVTDAQIRAVVGGMWEAVAVAVPNLRT